MIKHKLFITKEIKNSTSIFMVVLLSFFTLFSHAQKVSPNHSFILESSENTNNTTKKLHFKPQTQISLGGFAMSNSKGNYQLGSYIQPQIHFKLSEHLHISTGVSAMKLYNTDNNGLTETSYLNYLSPNSIWSYYIQGDYKINSHIHIYGEVNISKIEFSNINSFDTDNNTKNQLSETAQDYMLGVHYQIGKNSSIQLEMRYSKNRPYPYLNNSFNNEAYPLSAPHKHFRP